MLSFRALIGLLVFGTLPALAQEQTSIDYANAANWLCRPGKANDACAVDLTTTIVAASGAQSRETFTPAWSRPSCSGPPCQW